MKWRTFVVAVLFATTLILGEGTFAFTHSIAHAEDPCAVNGRLNIPAQTYGPFSNGHATYYAYLTGYQCGSTDSGGGQFNVGVQYYSDYTSGRLSTGTGVASVQAYSAGYQSCNGSPYGQFATGGGWFGGSNASSGIISFSLSPCNTGHDYFLKAYHYLRVHSTDNPSGIVRCSGDSVIYSGCVV